jgi:hypothetical protein
MQNNYGYLGAAWGNAANQNRQSAQGWSNLTAQNRQQQGQYGLARRTFGAQKAMDAQSQRDRGMQFSLNALVGLMR